MPLTDGCALRSMTELAGPGREVLALYRDSQPPSLTDFVRARERRVSGGLVPDARPVSLFVPRNRELEAV